MSNSLYILAAVVLSPVAAGQKPPPLQMLEGRRHSCPPCVVQWRIDGRNFTTEIAKNGDSIVRNWGYDDGWVLRPGEKSSGSRFPEFHLFRQGSYAFWQDDSGYAEVFDRPRAWEPVFDFRRLGTEARPVSMTDSDQTTSYEDYSIHWDTRETNGLCELRGTLAGRTEPGLIYYLDPNRGYVATRIVSGPFEADVDWQGWGGQWMPQHVTYRRDGEVTGVAEVVSIEPTDAASFDLGDIVGDEWGLNVWVRRGGQSKLMFWNGERLVTREERDAERKAGATYGPTMQRAIDGRPSRYLSPEGWLVAEAKAKQSAARRLIEGRVHGWRAYVERFIKQHRLTDEQTQRAWRVYVLCERRAEVYVRAQTSALYKLVDKLNTAQDADARKAALREREKLLAPLDRIFEHELKPRLEALLTLAQRRAAEAKTATQPAKARSEDR